MMKRDLPPISIITPTLNQGQYLAATVHSVMDQGYPNLEYRIMDGGSTDNTHEVLTRLKNEYGDNLQFEIHEGLRQVPSINRGLEKMTGEIMAYLNSDDVYLPGTLHAVARCLRGKTNAKWLAAPSIFFGGKHRVPVIMPSSEPPRDLVSWVHRNFTPQPSVFWRREAYDEFGGFDEGYRYRFDHVYWIKFIEKHYYPIWVETPLSSYRLHSTSFSCTVPEGFREEMLHIREEWLGKLTPQEQRHLRALIKCSEAEKIHEQALQTASSGHKGQALREWFSGIKHSPLMAAKLMTYLSLRRVIFPKPMKP